MRLDAAAAAAGALTAEQFVPVIRCALNLPASDGELAPFLGHFSADPTFGAAIGSPELRLLSAGVLAAAMTAWPPAAYSLPLFLATGLFGGTRAPAEYPGFDELVEEELDYVQQSESEEISALPKTPIYGPPAKFTEALTQKATENNLSGVVTDLMAVNRSLSTHAADQDDKTRAQLVIIAERVSQLSEQMGMQWWIMNGYSQDAKVPFAKLSAAVVVVRAALELAELTTRSSGVAASTALLDQVLERAKAKKKLSLAAVVTAPPIEWRRGWVFGTLALPNAALCPVIYAMRLATEANDQPDWKGRFEREVGISSALELDSLVWAGQLYRERLATTALS